jgi:hypothetical protein
MYVFLCNFKNSLVISIDCNIGCEMWMSRSWSVHWVVFDLFVNVPYSCILFHVVYNIQIVMKICYHLW